MPVFKDKLMMKIRILFLLIAGFSLFSIQAKMNLPATYWIAVEGKALEVLKKEKKPIFKFNDFVKAPKVNYYHVKEDDLVGLSKFFHHKLKRCGGYRVVTSPKNDLNKNPHLNLKSSLPLDAYFWPNDFDKFINFQYEISREAEVQNAFNYISEENVISVVKHLTSYHTRYYKSPEGEAALNWIGDSWQKMMSHRSDVTVERYQYANHNQPTIILTIEGSDSELKNEIIIVGGHGDSINADDPHAHLAAPGADDNAAGIAIITDTINVMAKLNYKPKRTLQFIAYAAEEVGIQGSYELARVYREKQKRVVGVLQLDGVNYKGPSYDIALIADSTHGEQNRFIARLIDTYVKATWTYDVCGYGCSDHAPWHSEGYRASFPIESIIPENNPFIHSAHDTFEKSQNSVAHALLFQKIALSYLIEMDNQ